MWLEATPEELSKDAIDFLKQLLEHNPKKRLTAEQGLEHPWMSSIEPLLPHFTKLTGIDVQIQKQSESEYVAEVPVKLGAGNPTPDVYMVWSYGQAANAGWLESLDQQDKALAQVFQVLLLRWNTFFIQQNQTLTC